jgi:putative transposase
MARPLRIEYPGAYYHVMNRGQSRRNIFIEDKGRQTFLDPLAERGMDGSDLSWQAIGRSQA